MSADDDVKLQSIGEMMSCDGPIDLFATDDSFMKAKGKTSGRDPYHKDKKPHNGNGLGTKEDRDKPITNMGQQAKVLKDMSKFGLPEDPSSKVKNITFDPASGEAVYWRGRNFPANLQDMADFSKKLRNGEYFPIYIDGEDLVIASAAGEKERHPLSKYRTTYYKTKDGWTQDKEDPNIDLDASGNPVEKTGRDGMTYYKTKGGWTQDKEDPNVALDVSGNPIERTEYEGKDAISRLLDENNTPAKWRGKTIIGAVPARQYETGMLPQIIATSGSGKARGELRGQDYGLEDKSSFDNYAVWNYLKKLIRGEKGDQPGTEYYGNTIGDMVNPNLLQSMVTMPEEERAALNDLSDDELSIKYPGVRRPVADLISSGNYTTGDMDTLSGLTGNQFRDALGKLAIKNMLTKEFGDKWQNLKDAAASEDATRSDKIRGGKRIGEEFHDPSKYLDVEDMIDYLTSDAGDANAKEKAEAYQNYKDHEKNSRTMDDRAFRLGMIMDMMDNEGISFEEANKRMNQIISEGIQRRAKDQAVSDAWSDKQLNIGKAGKKADEVQSKAQRTAAEYFGDDYDTLGRLQFNPEDIQTLKNFRDKHNTAMNSAVQKLMKLYGGQLPEKYKMLADYADKPLYPKVGEEFPNIDEMLSNYISGGADYNSAANQIGREFRTRNMGQALNLIRTAMNEPGNEDLLRKYNESREAQGNRDYQEMFKPVNQEQEDIVKTFQETYQKLTKAMSPEDAWDMAWEEVNRQYATQHPAEEVPISKEMMKRMTTPQDQYRAEQMKAQLESDAKRGAEIHDMRNPTGDIQPHDMAPNRKEAKKLAKEYGEAAGGLEDQEHTLNPETGKPKKLKKLQDREGAYTDTAVGEVKGFDPKKAKVAQKVVKDSKPAPYFAYMSNGDTGVGESENKVVFDDDFGRYADLQNGTKRKNKASSSDNLNQDVDDSQHDQTDDNMNKSNEKKLQNQGEELHVPSADGKKTIEMKQSMDSENVNTDEPFTKSIADIMDEDDLNLAEAMYIRTPYNLVVMQTGEPMKIEAPSETKGSEEHHVKNKMPSINDLMDN